MQKISGREALFAGFRLIGREPVAFLAWCVVTFALGIVPQVTSLGASLQVLAAMAGGGDALSAEAMAAQQQVMAVQPLIWLSSLAMIALLPAAVFRAVLRPEDRAFLYLRLSGREFWLVLIVLVMFVMYIVAILVGMIPFLIVVAVTAVAAGGSGEPSGGAAALGGLFGALTMLALIVVILWGALRFSFAPVMAFADSTFRLTESWKLTRGHGWKMFLVALALTVLTTIIYVVVLGVIIAVAGLDLANLATTMASDPQALIAQIGAPWLVVGAVATTVLSAAYYVLWAAAWAEMYRQLRPGVAETFA